MTAVKFEQCYRSVYQEVFAFVKSRVKDDAVAHDAMQEVATRILENKEVLAEIREETFMVWFKQRVKLYLNRHVWPHEKTKHHVEHNAVQMDTLLGTNDEGYHQDEPSDSPSLLETAMNAALDTLNPLEHEAILLRVFAGVPVDEAAEQLGVKPATFAKAYQRGIQKLRLALQSVGIEGFSFADNTTPETDQSVA